MVQLAATSAVRVMLFVAVPARESALKPTPATSATPSEIFRMEVITCAPWAALDASLTNQSAGWTKG
jgi:hypothetical protein